MLITVLALLMAAPAADAQPKPVSPLEISPTAIAPPVAATVDMAGDDEGGSGDFVAIWPASAYQTGTDGHVTLSCLVDIHGLAERCRVAEESPKNKGLGRAALELRPTFQLKPARGADGAPINATMSIGIAFKAPKKYIVNTEGAEAQIRTLHDTAALTAAIRTPMGNPLAMRAVTMLDDPVWAQAASFDDLARAYPAKAGGAEGYAAAHCRIERSGPQAGGLHDCQIIKESPRDLGFGKAALGLAEKFRVAPAAVARAPGSTPVWVDIPIRFAPPAELAERTVMAPMWVATFDPTATPKLFPPEAVAQGLTTGRGVARCLVAADGALTECAPEAGQPDGLRFSEAAAKLASAMKMNLWAADAAPVVGGVVHIPVRLNLKGPRVGESP